METMESKEIELVTVYAGRKADVRSLVEDLASYRPVYIQRLLHYAFIDLGLVEAEMDWSAYGDTPLFTDGEMNRVFCRKDKYSDNIYAVFAVFMSDARNLRWFVGRLPENMCKLLRRCLMKGSVRESEVRETLHINGSAEVFIDKDNFSWLCPTAWSVQQYRWSWGTRKASLEFVINDLLRPALLAIFFPDAADFTKLDSISDEFTVFSDEDGALRAMSDYDAMIAARMFDGISSTVTLPMIRKVASTADLKEFFGNDDDNKYRTLARARILANLLKELSGCDRSEMTAAARCRYCIENAGTVVKDIVRRTIMPQLKGRFASTSFDTMATELLRIVFRMVGRHSDHGKWIEAKGFIDYFHLLYGQRADQMLMDNYSFDRGVFSVKSGTRQKLEHIIALDERFAYLIVPMIQGTIFMLAAIGAVEIAFSGRESVNCSPFCGLMYWRITELGRYALGLVNSYDRKVEIHSIKDFTLDDRYLIVTVDNPDTSMRGLVERFAKPVTVNRYAVTPDTFLRNCRNAADIERTISMIENFVCADPPQIWIDFFNRIRRQARAVVPDDTDYKVYTVDPNDNELQRYIAMAPEMRDIVVCAQGYRVLVDEADDAAFRDRLRAKGYLM